MKKIKNKSILQFKLDFNFGYGYCKLLDFTNIDEWNGILIKVFDFISKDPIDDVDILKDCDYLLNGIGISRFPNLRGKRAWKVIGIFDSIDDSIIPVFKGVQARFSTVEDESKLDVWYPIYEFHNRGNNCDYKEVSHLEQLYVATSLNVVTRTTIEVMRKEKKNIEDFYDFNDRGFMYDYYRAINVPLYKDIPKEIVGKLASAGKKLN